MVVVVVVEIVVVEIVVVEIVVVETEVAVVAAGVDAHVLDVAAVGPIAVVVHDPVAVVGAGHVADEAEPVAETIWYGLRPNAAGSSNCKWNCSALQWRAASAEPVQMRRQRSHDRP